MISSFVEHMDSMDTLEDRNLVGEDRKVFSLCMGDTLIQAEQQFIVIYVMASQLIG